MANLYNQWSEYFRLDSKEEADWLKSVLQLNINDYPEVADLPDDDYDDYKATQKILAEKFGINVTLDEAEYFPGFAAKFEDDHSGVYLWSEYGHLENAANIFQAFLKKFSPDRYFKIEWASTCSKFRPGEFGGGAVFVTADNVEWNSTDSWISECKDKFLKGAK